MIDIVPPETPRIVAVVVNYNYARYVAGAVESLLAQTTPFDSIVVVDDGSTDDSLEVLRQYGDRIRVVTKENGGPLSAVWRALSETRSDYVYVLDADDLAESHLRATLEPYLEGGPIKVQFQLRSVDADGVAIDSIFPSYAAGYSSRLMIADNATLGFYVCAPTSGNLFRTDFLTFLTGKSLDGREAFDGVPAQLAPYFGEVVSLNRPLARYRVHGSSMSQWGLPTPDLMRREVERHSNRWRQATAVLVAEGHPAPDASRSAFVHERALMTAALQRQRPPFRVAVDYAGSTLRSRRTLAQRVVLVSWGIGLALLPRTVAHDLAVSKRSVDSRGPLAAAVARFTRVTRR